MKTMILFLLLLLPTVHAQECFHPERNKSIQSFLVPNKIRKNENVWVFEKRLNEDEEVIKKIHNKIREGSIRFNYDPRLIYARLMGEAQGNPFQDELNGNGAYGMFQFTQDGPTVKRVCDKAKNPRLCQVEYYIDKYMFRFSTDRGPGCKKPSWNQYSAFDKMSYLDQGQCLGVKVEKGKCFTPHYQWTGACKLIMEVINWEDVHSDKPRIPLCDDYLAPPTPGEPAILYDFKMKTDL